MTTNKELLQKLYKIAENQQKIIRKLAQAAQAEPLAQNTQSGSVQLDEAAANNTMQAMGLLKGGLKLSSGTATMLANKTWSGILHFQVPNNPQAKQAFEDLKNNLETYPGNVPFRTKQAEKSQEIRLSAIECVNG